MVNLTHCEQTQPPLLFSSLLQAKEPKATLKVDTMNATFQPEKIGNPNGLQITYLKDYSTRNIFVYHDSGKVCLCLYCTEFRIEKTNVFQFKACI